MGLGILDEEDPDMFDMEDEPEEEDEPVKPPAPSQHPPATSNGGRRLRVRPMKAKTIRKYPDVVSVLITFHDGRQLAMIRK